MLVVGQSACLGVRRVGRVRMSSVGDQSALAPKRERASLDGAFKEGTMSWFLIFISSFVPILLLVVVIMAESFADTRTKLSLVRVPLPQTGRISKTER